MSTKTTFKRVALVAVAALGLGVLSVVPSSAVPTGVTVTITNGTAGLPNAAADSSTAAIVQVAALMENTDSITVELVSKSFPATGSTSAAQVYLYNLDSVTPALSTTYTVDTTTAGNAATAGTFPVTGSTAHRTFATGTVARIAKGSGTAYLNHKFGVQFDSATATTRTAGTYTYTVLVKSWATGTPTPVATSSQDVSLVITAASTASDLASAANTTAFIGAPSTSNTSDTAISAVATAASAVAEIDVTINNAAGGTGVADDSVTATVTGAGVISFNDSTYGKSITSSVTNGVATISIRGDGTAGVGTITVTTKAGFSAVKTVNFYAVAAKTITASVAQPVLAVGANAGAIAVTAVDAAGTNWTGQAYIVASSAADALVAGSATTPVACAAWNSTTGILCPVTALTAGTAKFKVIDAATVALATATSNEVTVTVSSNPVASVKIAFDKATYAPFEKAVITVTPLDKDGKTLQGALRTNILATGGITTNIAFGSLSDTLTATSVDSSKTTGTGTTAGAQSYVVYMPAQGDVTIKATGGTALPLTGQVDVSATASIVNSSVDAATDAANEATDAANAATDAALAAADAADAATAAAQDASDAVAALSASVSKLISSLRAQITSLTNLVIKIQKKVRA
jgi:trimeric autotransporter adhesin